jgi:hypothetical protein
MYVSINKQVINFPNSFGILPRICQGKGLKTCSHVNCLRGQDKTVVACEPRVETFTNEVATATHWWAKMTFRVKLDMMSDIRVYFK